MLIPYVNGVRQLADVKNGSICTCRVSDGIFVIDRLLMYIAPIYFCVLVDLLEIVSRNDATPGTVNVVPDVVNDKFVRLKMLCDSKWHSKFSGIVSGATGCLIKDSAILHKTSQHNSLRSKMCWDEFSVYFAVMKSYGINSHPLDDLNKGAAVW